MFLTTCFSNEVSLLVIHPAFFSRQFCVYVFGKEVTRNCAPGKTDRDRQCHLHRRKQLIRWNEAVILLDNFWQNWAWPCRSWELCLQLDLLKKALYFCPMPWDRFPKRSCTSWKGKYTYSILIYYFEQPSQQWFNTPVEILATAQPSSGKSKYTFSTTSTTKDRIGDFSISVKMKIKQ